MDEWIKETLQSGGRRLICEQMAIIAWIPSSLMKALATGQKGRGEMHGLE